MKNVDATVIYGKKSMFRSSLLLLEYYERLESELPPWRLHILVLTILYAWETSP